MTLNDVNAPNTLHFLSFVCYYGRPLSVSGRPCYNNNNNNITIYKAHNVRKKLNLRRRQSLGGGKSNSV